MSTYFVTLVVCCCVISVCIKIKKLAIFIKQKNMAPDFWDPGTLGTIKNFLPEDKCAKFDNVKF